MPELLKSNYTSVLATADRNTVHKWLFIQVFMAEPAT